MTPDETQNVATGVARTEVRNVWKVMMVVVIAQAIAIFIISFVLANAITSINDTVQDVGTAQTATVAQTLQGCQRGNELRRAVRIIAEIQKRRAELQPDPPIPPPVIDNDAFVINNCRATVIRVTGFDPGGVSNFVGGN